MLHFGQLSLGQRHNRARGKNGGTKTRREKCDEDDDSHGGQGLLSRRRHFFSIVEMR
jgi:hypothetical protein